MEKVLRDWAGFYLSLSEKINVTKWSENASVLNELVKRRGFLCHETKGEQIQSKKYI